MHACMVPRPKVNMNYVYSTVSDVLKVIPLRLSSLQYLFHLQLYKLEFNIDKETDKEICPIRLHSQV